MLELISVPVAIAVAIGFLLGNAPWFVTWLKTRAGSTGKAVVADASKVAAVVTTEAAKVTTATKA